MIEHIAKELYPFRSLEWQLRLGAFVLVVVTSLVNTGCGSGSSGSPGTASSSTIEPSIEPIVESSEPIVPSLPSSNSYTDSSSSQSNTDVSSEVSVAPSSTSVTNYLPIADWPESWQQYVQVLEQPLVQDYCRACHQSAGIAKNTELVFGKEPYLNAQAFVGYLVSVDRAEYLLQKVAGFEGHGGGVVIPRNNVLYQQLEQYSITLFPELLSNPERLMSKGIFEPRERTLRRAALLFAERLPTEAELVAVRQNDEALALTVKGLMQGSGFNNFLMRGANDQLLTDGFLNGRFFEISNGFTSYYPVGSNKRYFAYESGDIWPFEYWNNEVYHSMVRAPLALISHIVMNDLPYTQIVTADYTLGNKSTAEFMRQDVEFSVGDKFELKPFKNKGQILLQPGHQQHLDPTMGLRIDQHGEWVDYPHAGILNEPAFLARYPSSDTNRNRLRAKMAYKLFLGIDIEALAARTLTPSDLQDTDNPTLNNAACAACHNTLDPIAAAFQNFGVDGWYRSSWLGLDALPSSYKRDADSPYQAGDLWFADMRVPGFDGEPIASTERTLAELGQHMSKDDRFAVAAIKFWWPAVMSDDLLVSPSTHASQIDKQLYREQQRWINETAQQFRTGFTHGKPYQLKDVLVAMVMSSWFRAEAFELESQLNISGNRSGHAIAGVHLLSPEELDAKVKALIGYAWGEKKDKWNSNGIWSFLDDQYRIYYGGIDSLGVTERAKAHNSLMANVAETQAVNLACATVLLDTNRDEKEKRLLRNQSRYVSPFSYDWQRIDLARPQAINISLAVFPGNNTLRISHLNADIIGPVVVENIVLKASDGTLITTHSALFNSSFLSLEGDKPTGIQTTNTTVLEQGYWEFTFNGQGYNSITISADIATPWDWPVPAELNAEIVTSASHIVTAEKNNSLHDDSASVETTLSAALSRGERVVRQQIIELFQLTQGHQYTLENPEVNHAFDLFVSLWQSLEMQATPMTLSHHQYNYCDLSGRNLPDISTQNTSDPQRLLSAWSHLMVYFFTDFYFLHE